MNILLTCAGRRNYLVRYFRDALNGRGKVYAADASADAPALQEADGSFLVPKVHDTNYLDRLLCICRDHKIGLLLSLNDLELPILAAQRDRFDAICTVPVVSSPRVVDTCFDKGKTSEFLGDLGIPGPRTYFSLAEARAALSSGEIAFPLVIKPRWGTASIGIEFPEDEKELKLAYRLVGKKLTRTFLAGVSRTEPERCVLIQERLPGDEYGLDIVNDLNGRHAGTFVKRKLAMRAGETDKAVTVRDDRLERLGAQIGRALGHVGNLDCDVFVADNKCYVLEMNPRFGGGYPFSHVAGANIPAALIAWAEGEDADPHWLSVRPGVTSAKCDRLVVCGKDVDDYC